MRRLAKIAFTLACDLLHRVESLGRLNVESICSLAEVESAGPAKASCQ